MTKLVHLIKNWLLSGIQKNINIWPKNRKAIIFDLAVGWLMAGISFGVSSVLFVMSHDAISRFLGCPLVILWGFSFLVYGVTTTHLYLEEFTKSHRD